MRVLMRPKEKGVKKRNPVLASGTKWTENWTKISPYGVHTGISSRWEVE
jgi:hypothetical protein